MYLDGACGILESFCKEFIVIFDTGMYNTDSIMCRARDEIRCAWIFATGFIATL